MKIFRLSTVLFSLMALAVTAPSSGAFESYEERSAAVERISIEEARAKVQAGEAFLVCAHTDKQCDGNLLEGALTRREFEEKLLSLPFEQEIIVYCS